MVREHEREDKKKTNIDKQYRSTLHYWLLSIFVHIQPYEVWIVIQSHSSLLHVTFKIRQHLSTPWNCFEIEENLRRVKSRVDTIFPRNLQRIIIEVSTSVSKLSFQLTEPFQSTKISVLKNLSLKNRTRLKDLNSILKSKFCRKFFELDLHF